MHSNLGYVGCMDCNCRNIQIIKCLFQLKEFQICFITMVSGLTLSSEFWFLAIFAEKCNVSDDIAYKIFLFKVRLQRSVLPSHSRWRAKRKFVQLNLRAEEKRKLKFLRKMMESWGWQVFENKSYYKWRTIITGLSWRDLSTIQSIYGKEDGLEKEASSAGNLCFKIM